MGDQATEWLDYAEADRAAATELLDSHEAIAAYHAHQAAEKGLKPLQIHRTGDYERTHDLVRLYRELDVPREFQSLLEDLNPADTAARYPDADEVHLDEPADTVRQVGELITQNHRGGPRLKPWEEARRVTITTVGSGRPTPTLNTKMAPFRFGDGGQANSAEGIRGERRAAG